MLLEPRGPISRLGRLVVMAKPTRSVEHLMRRAGFGLSAAEREQFAHYTYPMAVAALTEFNPAETNIDDKIGQSGYVLIRGANPNTVITDARQRWLFRMVHSPAPLQEKMALFWHHHFATAYSKISGLVGGADATRMMAAKPSEDSARDEGPDRAVPRVRARQFPRPARRGGEGSGDAVLARRPAERARTAAGELRPRADGAVHVRRRALHRVGRVRGGSRLHRLESRADQRGN